MLDFIMIVLWIIQQLLKYIMIQSVINTFYYIFQLYILFTSWLKKFI